MKLIKLQSLTNLCKVGIHYSGTIDGGMGDAIKCDICDLDKYPEVFLGGIIHKRSLKDPKPAYLERVGL